MIDGSDMVVMQKCTEIWAIYDEIQDEMKGTRSGIWNEQMNQTNYEYGQSKWNLQRTWQNFNIKIDNGISQLVIYMSVTSKLCLFWGFITVKFNTYYYKTPPKEVIKWINYLYILN